MPVVPPKMTEYAIKDPKAMEVEAEVDRQILCDTIVDYFNYGPSGPMQNRSQLTTIESSAVGLAAAGTAGAQTESTISQFDLGRVNIATYVCDFGNVIVQKTAKRSFRLTNCGKRKLSFNFEKKILNAAGITIEPDKVQHIMPNTSCFFNVILTTRQRKFGKHQFNVPIDVKDGPNYTIQFVYNLTIPELTLSQEVLDFDRVCVNTRKTMKIRIENNKEVPCDWYFTQKVEPSSTVGTFNKEKKEKEGERFQVWPHVGTLQPGQR